MKLSKTYEPNHYESDIYALWEKSGAFSPSDKGEAFAILMPPPNANASLHIGHAYENAIKDTVIRYQRMKGKSAVYIPGADHAGFETQVVYEKHLAKEGKSRFDFSREELYAQVYDFVVQNRGNMEAQIRALGGSVDWTRAVFTLDEQIVKTAYQTFKKMWDDKLIYRGERLVNYCTFHRTGFADIEVKYEEKDSPLYYLKYGPFVLATTRPETKFGDTAVAVHPDDERYSQYVGQILSVEGLNGPFEIRVIADEMVDRNFGTGVVKITPAHDFNDWEVAQRHNLEAVRVINHDGTLNHRAGKYAGMTVEEARKAVVHDLKEAGLLDHIDEHYKNRVGTCYKCGTVIEPMLMDQWFVDMDRLAAPAIEALKANKIAIYPEAKRQQIITYLEGVKDWNISRQIAWGIPIPAFQNVDDHDDWIFDDHVDQETIEVDGKTYRRDPDVFDTWFSSGQWPFNTLGYPDSEDFKKFFPSTFMDLGVDIMYMWASRMIALSLYITNEIPFKTLYLHGMIRDEQGRKMSKSLGNTIDPMEIIKSHGSDALRMGLLAGRSPGESSAYAPSKVEAARNFANKLWNIARLVESLAEDGKSGHAEAKTPADHWVLGKLQHLQESITASLDDYRFSEAYELLYHTVWDDIADWYIEAGKGEPNKDFLRYVLETILKIAHPFAPFVTETIWQTLVSGNDSLLMTQEWPEQVLKLDKKQAQRFEQIRTVVSEIRLISNALQVSWPRLYYRNTPFIEQNATTLKRLARLESITEVEDGKGMRLTTPGLDAWLDIDLESAHGYLRKLDSQLEEHKTGLQRLEGRLANESYVANAPKEVVDETRRQLETEKELIDKLKAEIAAFTNLTK